MSTDQPTNPHRGSDFTDFMIDEGLMPTPRTDAIAHAGHNESVYIARMTYLARQLERELAAERALADRLADSLKQSTEGFGDRLPCEESCECAGRRIVKANEESLAAWKEARSGTD